MKDFSWAIFGIAFAFGLIVGGIVAATIICHLILNGVFA